MTLRIARWPAGNRACRARSRGADRAVRLRRDPRCACAGRRRGARPAGAICGTNWIAQAPVPIDRDPFGRRRSWSWSQCGRVERRTGERSRGPAGRGASAGAGCRRRPPGPASRCVSSPLTVTVQRPVGLVEGGFGDLGAVPDLVGDPVLRRRSAAGTRGSRPRARTSGVQRGFCSNENEYRYDGMSQAQPGYVLSRQVPPRSSAFSRMTKSSHPACCSLIPMHSPANPDPTITTSVCPCSRRLPASHLVSAGWSVGLQPVQDLAGVRDDEGLRVVLVLRPGRRRPGPGSRGWPGVRRPPGCPSRA